jgi:hypothetical protein
MAGIANSVRLYNEAYELAWRQIVLNRINRAGAAPRLNSIIRGLIKAGGADSTAIATEAVDQMTRYQRT